MPDYDVNDVASVGFIADIPGFQLPPEAWTFAENARLVNDGAGSGATWNQLADTSSVASAAPVALLAVRSPTYAPWIAYASLSDLFVWDTFTVTNVSGPSAPYATVNAWDWVGTELSGIPIWTNNVKPPQYWTALSTSASYADMPQWTAHLGTSAACVSMRAFGPFLIALNVTLGPGGAANSSLVAPVHHPHGVIWSHPADPGTMPSSWNYADPTMDAGFTELNDAEAGCILDGLALKSLFIIYKEASSWIMRLVGGQYVMQLDPFLLQSGILATHCVALTGDGKFHFVATADDLIIHDGSTTTSLLDKRARRALFSRISVPDYEKCFCFAVPSQREMWFAYPEAGVGQISRAMIWNYSGGGNGVLYESQFTFASACVSEAVAGTGPWDNQTIVWDADVAAWDETARRRTLLADPTGNQILLMDHGQGRVGAPFTTTLQREALSFIAHRRLPMWDPLMDFKQRKYVRRIWPKMAGAPCNIRIGFTNTVGGQTQWGTSVPFDPSTQVYADFTVSGREVPSVEFTWSSDIGPGTLYGYKMEIFPAGNF